MEMLREQATAAVSRDAETKRQLADMAANQAAAQAASQFSSSVIFKSSGDKQQHDAVSRFGIQAVHAETAMKKAKSCLTAVAVQSGANAAIVANIDSALEEALKEGKQTILLAHVRLATIVVLRISSVGRSRIVSRKSTSSF